MFHSLSLTHSIFFSISRLPALPPHSPVLSHLPLFLLFRLLMTHPWPLLPPACGHDPWLPSWLQATLLALGQSCREAYWEACQKPTEHVDQAFHRPTEHECLACHRPTGHGRLACHRHTGYSLKGAALIDNKMEPYRCVCLYYYIQQMLCTICVVCCTVRELYRILLHSTVLYCHFAYCRYATSHMFQNSYLLITKRMSPTRASP